MLLITLIQFVFRTTFGMALAMAVTSDRLVTSGYFRVHLWVLLGLNTLAALSAWSGPGHLAGEESLGLLRGVLAAAIVATMLCYVGGVCWLYEQATAGKLFLWLVSLTGLVGALLATPWHLAGSAVLETLDVATGGALLGVTLAAMFLGHWYLNTPTMQLAPLQRLVLLMGVATLLRGAVAGCGLGLDAWTGSLADVSLAFIALRWLSGLFGVLLLTWMTGETLKIPNTQSATGILYVAVICVFLGELTSQLLSQATPFPL